MRTYKEKVPEYEAYQMTEVAGGLPQSWPTWVSDAYNRPQGENALWRDPEDPNGELLILGTFSGNYRLNWDDWLLEGPSKELFALDPVTFAEKYE